MSMEFSEFRRLLGAEPRSRDPSFLRARDSSPEFRAAAAEADRFEEKLERALALQVPADLPDLLRAIPASAPSAGQHRRGWRFAMAAAVLIAVGAASLTWRMNSDWDSVPDYVADHFRHDGPAMLALATSEPAAADVGAVLAEFGMTASPALAGIVSVIKTCPTPDGKGVHMVLDTERGLVTVIYMPGTAVADGEHIRFDDRDAVLVALGSGSAVIVGSESQQVAGLHGLIQASLVPGGGNT
jgi:hypothetical protein